MKDSNYNNKLLWNFTVILFLENYLANSILFKRLLKSSWTRLLNNTKVKTTEEHETRKYFSQLSV